MNLPANKRSGLVEAIQALKGVRGINFVFFEESDIVRHELVQSIIRAYRQHRYGENDGGGAPPDGAPPRGGDAGGARGPRIDSPSRHPHATLPPGKVLTMSVSL